MRPAEHLLDFGRPVAYYPGLVKYLGSVNAVLLFCQFFYWRNKTDNELGVYKSVEEIEQETGLSYREQATARKQLISRGVLIETHKRLEHRIYYRIDTDRLDALLSPADCAASNPPNAVPSVPNCETCNSRTAESAFRGERSAQFVHTEITTETTTEITKADSTSAIEKAFNLFWAGSTRKGSKKKAVSVFASLCKRDKLNPMEFAARLVEDVAARKKAGQFGFDRLHVTTYLNQERWQDEMPEQESTRHTGLKGKDYASGGETVQHGGF